MSLASRRIGDFFIRLQTCFLDNPGVALTPWQVEQVCGADEMTCRAIVDLLTEGGAIASTGDGRYVRWVPPPRSWSDRRRLSAQVRRGAFTQSALAG
jgi:hypothetical protein